MRLVLCQDCLAVRRFTQPRHEGKDRCRCGGEFCGCSCCNQTADLLKHGIRDPYELAVRNVRPGFKWTARCGVGVE